jgi:hypothetical protein
MAETERPAMLIEGLLPERALGLLLGPSNIGKTFVAQSFALHVAAGLPFMGRGVLGAPVLYYDFEGSRMKDRCDAWACHNWCDELPELFVVRDHGLNLANAEAVDRVLADAREVRRRTGRFPKLIVVDTVSRAIPGADENSAATMSAFVSHLDKIRSGTGSAILLVHHTGKDESRGARGNSSLPAATDTVLTLTRDGEVLRLAATKQRDLPRGEPLSLALLPVEIGSDRNGLPITSCVVVRAEDSFGSASLAAEPQLSPTEQMLLDHLRGLQNAAWSGWVPLNEWKEAVIGFLTQYEGKVPDTARKTWERKQPKLLELALVVVEDGKARIANTEDATSATESTPLSDEAEATPDVAQESGIIWDEEATIH